MQIRCYLKGGGFFKYYEFSQYGKKKERCFDKPSTTRNAICHSNEQRNEEYRSYAKFSTVGRENMILWQKKTQKVS